MIAVLVTLDFLFPPPLQSAAKTSSIVLDRNGHWVHAFTNSDGNWRFKANLEDIDPSFLDNLILVEDKRFYQHAGVDPLAIMRASFSALKNGRFVSGASTITMQTARLLEPRPRNLGSKFVEILRAFQIERRLSKDEILSVYLTLAPYGGNIQGVRAASLVWFNKEPLMLTSAEQALLIALPQSPEARRPDRKPKIALKTRAQILNKLTNLEALSQKLALEASTAILPKKRSAFPRAAWHFSYQISQKHPSVETSTSLDLSLQNRTESIVSEYVEPYNDDATGAVIIVDNKTHEIITLVGSAGLDRPGGWIDLTSAIRSPGSTLKPFIYALAFEDGTLHADSIIKDMPRSFGGYNPENFDRTFRGEVRMREALQHSLNIPAVSALEQIGSARFAAALTMAGTKLQTPEKANKKAGLAIALGGAGIRMREMAMLYTALATDGSVKPLRSRPDQEVSTDSYQLISSQTAATIRSILQDAPSLKGRVPARLVQHAPNITFKTGTSYGYRDAWAAGVNNQYTVITWIGRADGAPRPGKTGRNTAAPLLFSIFDMLQTDGQLQQRPSDTPNAIHSVQASIRPSREPSSLPPQIIFPRNGIEVFYDPTKKQNKGLALTARGGSGTTQWYVDGQKIEKDPLGDRFLWHPNKEGFYTLSAVDVLGQSSTVTVRVSNSL